MLQTYNWTRHIIANSKIGLTIEAIIGFTFVIWSVFPQSAGTFWSNYSTRSLFSIIFMDLPVVLSGAVSGLIIEGLFIKKYIFLYKPFIQYKIGSTIGCAIGVILFFPLGCFLGMIGGGVWGGALGSAAGYEIGAGKKGIPVGIVSGILFVSIIITLIGALIGCLIGLAFDFLIRNIFN
jgi:hypothetical protein